MLKLIILLSFSFVVAGCNSLHYQKMDMGRFKTFDIKLTYDYENNNASNYFLNRYDASSDKKAERNRIMFEIMAVIDDNYGDFERDLRKSKGYRDSLVDVTSLVLTSAGSVANGGAPKILAALDTVLKGSNSSLDKNLLGDRLPELLINKMRAGRAGIAAEIFEKMNKPDAEYPLQAGLRDLMRYFQEGSVTSSLASLVSDTATDASKKAELATQKQISIK